MSKPKELSDQFQVLRHTERYKSEWVRVVEFETIIRGKAGLYSVVERSDAVVIVVRDEAERYLLTQS